MPNTGVLIVATPYNKMKTALGWETHRPWADKAIARTTPALFGLFALVCLMAYRLTEGVKLMPQSTRWYLKDAATFSDVLACVRRALWAGKYFPQSPLHDDQVLLSLQDWESLLDQLAATA
jgi:hypothetical protein